MRNPDGTLIGDLGDGYSAKTSGSITVSEPVSTTDENQTTYDLLPVFINRPPDIIKPITEASTPNIKPYATANASGDSMYLFPDGTVKVGLGASFRLSIDANQPNILNVENGIPKILPSDVGLTYVWKKDGIAVSTYVIDSLQASLTIGPLADSLVFQNVQPAYAGTYTCEISNDVGTVVSEPITLEVLNLDFDSYFYKNLVKNPYGADGTSEWESSNSDLTTKNFSNIPSQEFMKPHRVDLFGYTADMLHPRPYQIDLGVLSGFDMSKTLLSDKATYFTRSRYKFEKKGGTFLVRAYQDIDLTEIQWLIKGGVYGVDGVRALFSCYIGSALTSYTPTQNIVDPAQRTNPRNYVQNRPRLGIENFLNSGPGSGVLETTYVTVEEYDNETRLPSALMTAGGGSVRHTDRITLLDPWQKRLSKYVDKKYYPTDTFGIGETSQGDGRDQMLFVADELYPDITHRHTYGQYCEFNKIIFERLNPNTTKVRISVNFETNDWRIFESWKEAYEATDEVREFVGWETPFAQHTFVKPIPADWTGAIGSTIRKLPRVASASFAEAVPAGNDPRGMITALNLTLIPIQSQQKETTKYYTNTTLAKNDTPASNVSSGLGAGRPYDPFGVTSKKWNVTLKHYADAVPHIDSAGKIVLDDFIDLQLDYIDKDGTKRLMVDPISIVPFQKGGKIVAEGNNIPIDRTTKDINADKWTAYSEYLRFVYVPQMNGLKNDAAFAAAHKRKTFGGYAEELGVRHRAVVLNTAAPRIPYSDDDQQVIWDRKIRYLMHFNVQGAATLWTKLAPVKGDDLGVEDTLKPMRDYISEKYLSGVEIPAAAFGTNMRLMYLQSYYLDVDFSKVQQAGDGKSSVRLWRNSELLGSGATEVFLSHSIDSYGVLRCRIPSSFVTLAGTSGGMGYNIVPISNEVKYKQKPIDAIKSLHINLGNYVIDSNLHNNEYYTAVVKQVFEAIEVKKQHTTTPTDIASLAAFSSSLNTYAFDKTKAFTETNWNDQLVSIWSIDGTNAAFYYAPHPPTITKPPHLFELRDTTNPSNRPSLAAIESIDPFKFNDGFITPTAGVDALGNEYVVAEGPIQDERYGNYKQPINP